MGPDAMIFVFWMVRFKPAFSLSFFTFIKRFLGYSLLSAIRMMSSACCCCCPTLCDPIDSSLPGSSILGILQARTLGWVAISFSNAWKWKVKVKSLSHVLLFVTPWAAVRQASLSITNSWSLLKLMSIESVMPSNHIILCHPLFLLPSIFPRIRVFSSESVLLIRWPKYWFQLQHQSFQWIFRTDFL